MRTIFSPKWRAPLPLHPFAKSKWAKFLKAQCPPPYMRRWAIKLCKTVTVMLPTEENYCALVYQVAHENQSIRQLNNIRFLAVLPKRLSSRTSHWFANPKLNQLNAQNRKRQINASLGKSPHNTVTEQTHVYISENPALQQWHDVRFWTRSERWNSIEQQVSTNSINNASWINAKFGLGARQLQKHPKLWIDFLR